MNHQFTLMLSSSHCTDVFPDNKPTNFKVRLPYRLGLNSSWRVGLSELAFTNSLFTFQSDQTVVIRVEGIEKRETTTAKVVVKAKHYASLRELIDTINHDIKMHSKYIVDVFSAVSLPYFKLEDNDIVKIVQGESDGRRRISIDAMSKSLINTIGTDRFRQAYLNASQSNIYVYSDIVAPRIIGDVSERLLRQVDSSTNQTIGSLVRKTYKNPQYCNLANFDIQEIEIQLLDDRGKPVRFQYGEVSVILQFTQT